jgi:hypothetical protein
MPDDCSRMAHEVHERSCDEDILLIMLREILKHNPECKLRVILMSATLSQTMNVIDTFISLGLVTFCVVSGWPLR